MSFTESLEELVTTDKSGLLAIAPWWSRVRLGDVCSILNGFPFSSQRFRSEGGMPLIRIRDVLRGSTETHYVGEFDPAFVVRHGELVVGMDGDFNCAQWTGPDALLNQRVCKITPDETRYSRRLLLLALPGYLSAINRKTSSITVKHLSSRTVHEIPLPLPPRDEQDQLADAIEFHFSRLDAATANLERVQRNLERYRASVLKAAVEGRLVPTEAELAKKESRSYEPASALLKRILAERRGRWEEAELAKLKGKGKTPTDDRWKTRYEEPAAPDLDGLSELPEGWCWASLGQLLTHLTSGSRDWTSYYDRGTGVFLMAQNVRPGRLDLSFLQLVDPPLADASRARSQVEEGDLLVTIVGANTGDVCRIHRPLPEHYVCQSVALMRPVLRSLSRYLDAYLNSPPGQAVFDRFMYGQGRPHLGFDELETTPVPLPPADEAERIVSLAEDKVSVTEAVAAPIAANETRIARLRQSILKLAFEGRLIDHDAAVGTGVVAQARARRVGARRAPKSMLP